MSVTQNTSVHYRQTPGNQPVSKDVIGETSPPHWAIQAVTRPCASPGNDAEDRCVWNGVHDVRFRDRPLAVCERHLGYVEGVLDALEELGADTEAAHQIEIAFAVSWRIQESKARAIERDFWVGL